MKVLTTLKWLVFVVVPSLVILYSIGPALAAATVNLPVRKVDPLTGQCVAFLIEQDLITCYDDDVPERYRNEPTFPHAKYEQLLLIHKSM
jgi:hypothetical protein